METLETLTQIERDALQRAADIHRMGIYTQDHKTREIAATFRQAARQIGQTAAEQSRALAVEIERVNRTMKPVPEISDTDAPKLLYLQQSLTGRWRTWGPDRILDAWQTAIDGGDTLVARVYADNAESVLFATPRPSAQQAQITARYHALTAQTEDLLIPAEWRTGREHIAELQSQIDELDRAARDAVERLAGATYDPATGEITDGQRRRVRDMIGREQPAGIELSKVDAPDEPTPIVKVKTSVFSD